MNEEKYIWYIHDPGGKNRLCCGGEKLSFEGRLAKERRLGFTIKSFDPNTLRIERDHGFYVAPASSKILNRELRMDDVL